MAEEVKWVRKATAIEVVLHKEGQSGNYLSVFRMSFCARRPVEPQRVEEALSLLYRKTPNLRLCLAERDEEVWFREMDEERIPFEVSAADVDEVTDFLHTQGYPKDGPLWRARLVVAPTPRYNPQRFSSFHDDLQDTFPHCYHLLFGFSHDIGDGHAYVMICAAFAHILDHLLSGEEVNEEQIGSFDGNEEYDSKVREFLSRFNTDEAWRDEYIGKFHERKPLVLQLFSPCEDHPKKTVLHTQTLDQATTTILREKCRTAQVTLNSCIAAAGNMALVDLLVEKGVVQDTYTISNLYHINMRRTWPKGTTEQALGSYVAVCRHNFLTPLASEDDQFWQCARDIHSKLHDFLNDDQFMQNALLSLWCSFTNQTERLRCDITYNTRGDLTQKFEGTSEITVTNLLSSSAIHNTRMAWEHSSGTLRGRLSHTIKYNSGLMSEATVLRYSDLVYGRLMKVAVQ